MLKCVFYRPEYNAKQGTHEIEFLRSSNVKNERYTQIELKG